MKTRHWVIISVVVIMLGLFLWWNRDKHRSASGATKPTVATGQSNSDTSKKKTVLAGATTASANIPALPQPKSKGEQTLTILQKYNHRDIEIYGKVIDQKGQPLSEVAVYGSVIYNSGLKSGLDKAETKTDANGFFSFHGLKGRTLGIGLDKVGYEYGGEHGPFQFTELVKEEERYHPDPNNPVIFVMWKLQGAEPMIHMQKDFKIPPEGTPVRIDLTTGKSVEQGGDLVITLRHEVWAPGVQGKRPFDWTLQLGANNGGFSESTQRLLYLAPEDGYAPGITIDMRSTKTGWEPDVNRTFYLRSRGQMYSRVGMVFNANPNQERGSYLSLQWWLNPMPGSRNLEFDPKKTAVKP